MRRMIAIALTLMLAGAMSAASVQAGSPLPPVDQGSTAAAPQPAVHLHVRARARPHRRAAASYDPTYENEPIGLFCDGREIYDTGRGHERLTRWHLADGRATRTHRRPSTTRTTTRCRRRVAAGPRIGVGHWVRAYTYPNPGDRATRVFTELGLMQRIRDDQATRRLAR